MNKILKYQNYLNEEFNWDEPSQWKSPPVNIKEMPLLISNRFKKMISSIDSKISKKLFEIINNDEYKFQLSYIDLTEDIDFLSVLPVSRLNRLEGIEDKDFKSPSEDSIVWNNKFRQNVRIGTFIVRILPEFAGSKDLENFVHLIKGKLDEDNYELRIVKGEEIRKWYHVKNYYNPTPGLEDVPEGDHDPRTPLMKSCLKQPEKQDFFDIYCSNPDKVGMLIMLNKNNKLVARAIIWFDCYIVDNPTNPTKGVLMDRIYYTNESDVNIFIDYAKKQGWWYKPSQAKEIYSYVVDGKTVDKPITTKLTKHGVFPKYPYIDTMCYYTPETGRLSTSRGRPAANPKTGEIMDRYQLHRANGGTKKLARGR